MRFLLLWLILLPVFYFWGLPVLMEKLTLKARAEGFASCMSQLKTQGLTEGPNAVMTSQKGESYCHCATDGLTFTHDDLMDAVQRKPAAKLNERMAYAVNECNGKLSSGQLH
jgi:hypothetical protein